MAKFPDNNIKNIKYAKKMFSFQEKLLISLVFMQILNLLVVSYPYILTHLLKY